MNDGDLEKIEIRLEIGFSAEEMAAIEGWRQANDFGSQSDALRHLVRLGLLSELGRVYQSIDRTGDAE